MLRDLVEAQTSLGMKVNVVSLWPNSGTSIDVDLQSLATVTYLDKKPGFDPLLGRALRRHIESATVLHSHREAFRYLWMSPMRRDSTPWIHTLHSEPRKEAHTRLDALLRKRAFRTGRVRPVALSPTLADSFANYYKLDEGICASVPNGVPVQSAPFDFTSELKRAVFIGRLVTVKDPLRLIDIMGVLGARFPDLTIDVFGQGELEQALRHAIDVADMTGRIRIMGIEPHMRDKIGSYDVLLNTSLAEGLPISLLEAAAAGLAIIAPKVGGVGDFLGPDNPGLVSPRRRPEEYLEALLTITQKTKRANLMNVQANYSARGMAEAYLSIYDEYSLGGDSTRLG